MFSLGCVVVDVGVCDGGSAGGGGSGSVGGSVLGQSGGKKLCLAGLSNGTQHGARGRSSRSNGWCGWCAGSAKHPSQSEVALQTTQRCRPPLTGSATQP